MTARVDPPPKVLSTKTPNRSNVFSKRTRWALARRDCIKQQWWMNWVHYEYVSSCTYTKTSVWLPLFLGWLTFTCLFTILCRCRLLSVFTKHMAHKIHKSPEHPKSEKCNPCKAYIIVGYKIIDIHGSLNKKRCDWSHYLIDCSHFIDFDVCCKYKHRHFWYALDYIMTICSMIQVLGSLIDSHACVSLQ